MKNNHKLLICSILLLIFLLCVTSCGGDNSPISGTTDSDIDSSETTRDEMPGFLGNICGGYPIVEYVPTEFSAFNKYAVVIAEFGEPIISNESSGEKSLLTLAVKSVYGDHDFNVFPIKIHKKFDATAYSDESFFRADAMVYKEEAMGIDRDQSLLNFVIDYNNKAEVMSEYDDIVLIKSNFSKDIVIGEKYLFVMFMQAVDYHYITYDIEGNEYEHEGLFGLAPLSDNKTKYPNIIPVKDGKICLPDDFYKRQSYPNHKSFVRSMAYITEEANEMLKKLGLTDNLFRDGMTIDELDEYFNLVTNKDTFAPLFEDVDTQEP